MQSATLLQHRHNISARLEAASSANADDADMWRWFSMLYEEGRIRWCKAARGWLVSVDHKHVATAQDFDAAIRAARENFSTEAPVGKRYDLAGQV